MPKNNRILLIILNKCEIEKKIDFLKSIKNSFINKEKKNKLIWNKKFWLINLIKKVVFKLIIIKT